MTAQNPASPHRPGAATALAGAIVAAATLAAYANSFGGPFVFDDAPAIRDNAAIRHWSTAWHWTGGGGSPTAGRPIVSLSLALNYALGGLTVTGYHAVNLLIHILAALTLFGVVRRTLAAWQARQAPREKRQRDAPATWVACAAALLWALHPLQTESVTYLAQRAESLMGLCYLATLYGFIRYTEADTAAVAPSARSAFRRGCWAVVSVGACLLGMACKEAMVTAPLMVWLFDRTFVSGRFGTAIKRHRGIYFALAATWVLLLALVLSGDGRNRTAGFHAGVEWWQYALVQLPALVHYLRLAVWPQALVFDYGRNLTAPVLPTVAAGLAIVVLLAITIWALRRRPILGFFGAWFFLILAPTSSILPVATEVVAEHRMYLPLVAVTVLVALALRRAPTGTFALLTFALAAGLGFATAQRNQAYRSELALWEDTAAHRPENADAQYNLGLALTQAGRIPEAAARYAAAVAAAPAFAQAQINLGFALDQLGHPEEALGHFETAVRLRPDLVEAQNNLANLLCRLGRGAEAITHYQTALHWQPNYLLTHLNLGLALTQARRLPEAAQEFQTALRLQPDSPEAYFDLGNVLAEGGANAEAIQCYEAALHYRPDFAAARSNLDVVRARLQNFDPKP